MYIYVFICVQYVYIYVYTHIYIYVYVCVCIHMYIYMYTYIHVYIYICTYICLCVYTSITVISPCVPCAFVPKAGLLNVYDTLQVYVSCSGGVSPPRVHPYHAWYGIYNITMRICVHYFVMVPAVLLHILTLGVLCACVY